METSLDHFIISNLLLAEIHKRDPELTTYDVVGEGTRCQASQRDPASLVDLSRVSQES